MATPEEERAHPLLDPSDEVQAVRAALADEQARRRNTVHATEEDAVQTSIDVDAEMEASMPPREEPKAPIQHAYEKLGEYGEKAMEIGDAIDPIAAPIRMGSAAADRFAAAREGAAAHELSRIRATPEFQAASAAVFDDPSIATGVTYEQAKASADAKRKEIIAMGRPSIGAMQELATAEAIESLLRSQERVDERALEAGPVE